jgi:hypothetical protein
MNYILPKVNISYKENETSYSILSNSLQHYLATFEPTNEIENKIVMMSKYKPKSNSSFFVMLELLHSNRIPDTTKITYVGSDACLEAFDWIKQNISFKLRTNLTQLIIGDIDDFKEQVLYVLKHQNAGGMCFLRIADTTNQDTIQLIYILCACYENVHICKPRAISNSSLVKYIVCTQFKKIVQIDNYDKLTIPYYFMTKINELNAMYGQIQFEYLQYTDDSKEKWIHWCSEFSIPI